VTLASKPTTGGKICNVKLLIIFYTIWSILLAVHLFNWYSSFSVYSWVNIGILHDDLLPGFILLTINLWFAILTMQNMNNSVSTLRMILEVASIWCHRPMINYHGTCLLIEIIKLCYRNIICLTVLPLAQFRCTKSVTCSKNANYCLTWKLEKAVFSLAGLISDLVFATSIHFF